MTWRAGGDGRPISFPCIPWHEPCDELDFELREDDRRELAAAQTNYSNYPDLGQHDDITQADLDDPDT